MTGECTKHGRPEGACGHVSCCPGTGERGLQGVTVRDCRKKCGRKVCYPKNVAVVGIGICDLCLDSVSG